MVRYLVSNKGIVVKGGAGGAGSDIERNDDNIRDLTVEFINILCFMSVAQTGRLWTIMQDMHSFFIPLITVLSYIMYSPSKTSSYESRLATFIFPIIVSPLFSTSPWYSSSFSLLVVLMFFNRC